MTGERVHGVYESPDVALAFLKERAWKDARISLPDRVPVDIFSRDREMVPAPFVTLATPSATLSFVVKVLLDRVPELGLWSKLRLEEDEGRITFDCSPYFTPNRFGWARVKLDACVNRAPLKLPPGVAIDSLTGLATLTALACHPERLRLMLKRPNPGLWLPGIRVAPVMDSRELDVVALHERGGVLRIGRNPNYGVALDPTCNKPLLLGSAPGHMMNSGYTIPNLLFLR